MNIVQFMDKFQIGYQLSACPLVPVIKLLKRRIIRYMMSCFFFCYFFVNRFFVCFQERFNTTVLSRYSVCRWIFFLRDHRRTSPFSNLFKILLDFGTELLLFPNCFISECSVFFVFFFFCILYSLSLRLKYQFFTRPPTTHTHFQTLYSTAGSYLLV